MHAGTAGAGLTVRCPVWYRPRFTSTHDVFAARIVDVRTASFGGGAYYGALKRPAGWPDPRQDRIRESLFSRTVEEALFFRSSTAHGHGIRTRVRDRDGTARRPSCARAGTPRRAPTSSRCVSTRSAIPTRPARSPGRRRPSSSRAGAARKAGGSTGARRTRRAMLDGRPRRRRRVRRRRSSATGSTTRSAPRRGRRIVLSPARFRGLSGGSAIARGRDGGARRRRPEGRRDQCRASPTAGGWRPSAGSTRGRRIVLIAMGEAGLVTRLLPGRFGSRWTYAGDGVAPGQIAPSACTASSGSAASARDTALYGVVGRPVAHSLSPAMHNAAFAALGLDAVYVPLAAADADDLSTACAMLGLAGASVTAPFKVEADDGPGVMRRGCAAHRRGQHARARRRTLARRATPTSTGFWRRCAGVSTLNGTRVAVLGAGGAARAVALARAACRGASVTVLRPRPGEGRRAGRGARRRRGASARARGGLGPARERDAGRHAARARTSRRSRSRARRPRRLRPGLQPGARRGSCARRRARGCQTIGGLEHARRPGDAAVRAAGRASGRLPGSCARRRRLVAVARRRSVHEH